MVSGDSRAVLRAPRLRFGGALALALLLAACGPGNAAGDGGGADASGGGEAAVDVFTGPVTARFSLPRSGPVAGFGLPWPSDLARDERGAVDLRWIPNERNNVLVQDYVAALAGKLDGFSTVGGIYVRFSGPIDTATLPSLAGSTSATASVQLIDVDPTSPERGRRVPLQFYFREVGTRYWPSYTLAVAPEWGFPLRGRTRYALAVTDRLRAHDGARLLRDADFDAMLAANPTEPAAQRARMTYGPALDELERVGVQRTQLVSLAVFTTQDPVGELFRAVEATHRTPQPQLREVRRDEPVADFTAYRGRYGPTPVFQQGATPYDSPGSGGFVTDAMGVPMPQGMIDIAFTLTVPPGEMPAAGWPVVIYAHGTGGDASSFVSDGTARSLAAQGVATFGFDQIFNGGRTADAMGTGSPEVQFFNFLNPIAGRTNNRQAAVDLAQAARLVRGLELPRAMTGDTRDVKLSRTHVGFFGHSQGSLTGPLWLAAEEGATAVMLSGAGSTFNLAVTQKVEPVDIPRAIAVLLQISTTNPEELVPLHPVLTMLQTAIDVSDPVNYARYLFREPRMNVAPRHVYLTQGFVDRYSPPATAGALALALGLPLVAPVPHPVDAYGLTGLDVSELPLENNVGMGRATGGWQQFDARRNRDGHFVVFDIAEARDRVARFFGSWARSEARVARLTAR